MMNAATSADGEPLPPRRTCCGLVAASSLTARVALRGPAAVGAKYTSTVQDLPAARVKGVAGQLPPTRLKSEGLAPLRVSPVTCRSAVPLLVIVTACTVPELPTGSVPKSMLSGDTVAAVWAPTPVRVMDWVDGLAMSVNVRVALRVPAPPGVNVICTPQLPPAGTVGGWPTQPDVTPVIWKSPGSAPRSEEHTSELQSRRDL